MQGPHVCLLARGVASLVPLCSGGHKKWHHEKPEIEKHYHYHEVEVPEGYSHKPHGKPTKIPRPTFKPNATKEHHEHKVCVHAVLTVTGHRLGWCRAAAAAAALGISHTAMVPHAAADGSSTAAANMALGDQK